jgi:hypothetical protein
MAGGQMMEVLEVITQPLTQQEITVKQILTKLIASALLTSVGLLACIAQAAEPSTSEELFAALKLTESQHTEFKALDQERKEAAAGFKKLKGEELRSAQNNFYSERKKKLRKIFTEDQWAIWSGFWNRPRTAVTSQLKPLLPIATTPHEQPDLIGRKGFVHAERIDGVWFMVNADGERFIPTGMNHVGPMHRFAPYNREHWLKAFGPEVFVNGRIDYKGAGVKRWMEQIAKDHKDNGFNTLAFHHPPPLPSEYCNELGLYYFAKMRMSHVHARRAKTMSPDKKFPDVFDPAWIGQLDSHVKRFTGHHKDAKYLLGYSYDDLPAYTIHHLEKRISKFEHHPWIIDIITKPGLTEGKRTWIEVLKTQYPSANEAAAMYRLNAADWDEFGGITQWGLPEDQEQGFADQAMMNAKIVEAYHKAHHDAIRRYDPNHLILGDKIQNQRPQPDWVWEIVRNYVDVIVIQDYDFFSPGHSKKLRHIHALTGKPMMNGDHSYGALRPNMKAVKGVKVASAEAKGQQYANYLEGIMKLPFMVGWQTCGYLETWTGTSDATGKQQTGYFDPFGKPIEEALSHARAANKQALQWHESAQK